MSFQVGGGGGMVVAVSVTGQFGVKPSSVRRDSVVSRCSQREIEAFAGSSGMRDAIDNDKERFGGGSGDTRIYVKRRHNPDN